MIPRHRFQRLHFVGVGGAGMAPLRAHLAHLLVSRMRIHIPHVGLHGQLWGIKRLDLS